MPRVLPEPTPVQTEALSAVARAAEERAKWDRIYVNSILEAHRLGLTAVQIARVTGTSYQSVQKMLARGPRN